MGGKIICKKFSIILTPVPKSTYLLTSGDVLSTQGGTKCRHLLRSGDVLSDYFVMGGDLPGKTVIRWEKSLFRAGCW